MAHVVVFAGEYDLANKEQIRRTMQRVASSDNLVLNLTEVTFSTPRLSLGRSYHAEDADLDFSVEFAPSGDNLDNCRTWVWCVHE